MSNSSKLFQETVYLTTDGKGNYVAFSSLEEIFKNSSMLDRVVGVYTLDDVVRANVGIETTPALNDVPF